MTTIVASFDEDGELSRRLANLVAALEQPRDLFEVLGQLLETNIENRFDAKQDPSGNAWAPLAPSTAERYARRKVGGTLLERTRRLRGGLTHNADDSGVDVGFTPYAAAGGEWEVAELHEFGTTRMPRRGLLTADPLTGQLGADDVADIQAEIERFINGVL